MPDYLTPIDREANEPQSPCLRSSESFRLQSGEILPSLQIAYNTYGELNAQRDNAILICHALTGDQYLAQPNPITGKPGWWRDIVKSGGPVDTDNYFVICANVLGGCMGTTGPANLRDGKNFWGADFPAITVSDMVRAQQVLLDHLQIDRLAMVIGGSMGGMLALEWAANHGERVNSCLAIATSARHTPQNIAFHELGRQAIKSDRNFHAGNYRDQNLLPSSGLAIARMAGHITYLSAVTMQSKFGRRVQDSRNNSLTEGARAEEFQTKGSRAGDSRTGDSRTGDSRARDPRVEEFQVESYLRHQGTSFPQRFDANSYIALTEAMDHFDLAASHELNSPESSSQALNLPELNSPELNSQESSSQESNSEALKKAFASSRTRFLLISFSSDWLFPTTESLLTLKALNDTSANASFIDIETNAGHDSFLLDIPVFAKVVSDLCCSDWQRRAKITQSSTRSVTPVAKAAAKHERPDHDAIMTLVAPDSKVLDVGCGDGDLLYRLREEQGATCQGLEMNADAVSSAIAKGLACIHADGDHYLTEFQDNSFDYAILSLTLQSMKQPKSCLHELLRIGRRAIVSFPNFGYWKVRLGLLATGRMPNTKTLPHRWYNTPNIHLCTIDDFEELAQEMGAHVEQRLKVPGGTKGNRAPSFRKASKFRNGNFFAERGIFLLSR